MLIKFIHAIWHDFILVKKEMQREKKNTILTIILNYYFNILFGRGDEEFAQS